MGVTQNPAGGRPRRFMRTIRRSLPIMINTSPRYSTHRPKRLIVRRCSPSSVQRLMNWGKVCWVADKNKNVKSRLLTRQSGFDLGTDVVYFASGASFKIKVTGSSASALSHFCRRACSLSSRGDLQVMMAKKPV